MVPIGLGLIWSKIHFRLVSPNSENIDTDLYNGALFTLQYSTQISYYSIYFKRQNFEEYTFISISSSSQQNLRNFKKPRKRTMLVYVFPKKNVYAVESCVQAPYAANYYLDGFA